jgi:hypothetical protein
VKKVFEKKLVKSEDQIHLMDLARIIKVEQPEPA